jgi:tRNA(Arg) A34 adenosine deaminase TadA
MDAVHGTSIVIVVPAWIDEVVGGFAGPFETDDDRMALAIALSRHNLERGGGPFGAAVFAGPELVAAGVNLVLTTGFSIAHAEIVAMMSAQRVLRDLPPIAAGRDAIRAGAGMCLAASTEPCCQCFGALVWSGIQRLICGANTADAEAIGFDEGPKPASWTRELESRGVSVAEGVRHEEARAVLAEYARRGGPIYGLRAPGSKRSD